MVQSITPPPSPSDKCITTDSSDMNMNACAVVETKSAYNHMPLSELSKSTRQKLALMLNRTMVLRSEEGHERDWRGLGTLARLRGLFDENAGNPMENLLNAWILNSAQTAKVGYLLGILDTIERWDVCDDIHENLVRDYECYDAKLKRTALSIDETNNTSQFIIPNEADYRPVEKYDALVLYADADFDLAIEIMENLENHRKHKFKVYLRDRDMLGGVQFEPLVLVRFIEERCNHLIVVLTDEFLRSSLNAFLVNCTQLMQIQNNLRKIIPITYKENISVPRSLGIYTHLKYTNKFLNFWDKLAESLLDTQQLSHYSSLKTEMRTQVYAPTTPAISAHTVPRKAVLPATKTPPRIAINGQLCSSHLELQTIEKSKLNDIECNNNNNNSNINNNNNNINSNNNNDNNISSKLLNGKKFGKMRAAQSVDVLNTSIGKSNSDVSSISSDKTRRKFGPFTVKNPFRKKIKK